MKKFVSLLYLTLLFGTCCLHSQNNASVAYNYDADGNRTSLNYIIIRVDEDTTSNDTVRDITNYDAEEPNSSISVYPNPTSGYLVLSFNSLDYKQPIHVSLYSLQGNIIEDRAIDSDIMEFNLSDYPAGVYFLSVIYGNERNLWKIIKK